MQLQVPVDESHVPTPEHSTNVEWRSPGVPFATHAVPLGQMPVSRRACHDSVNVHSIQIDGVIVASAGAFSLVTRTANAGVRFG